VIAPKFVTCSCQLFIDLYAYSLFLYFTVYRPFSLAICIRGDTPAPILCSHSVRHPPTAPFWSTSQPLCVWLSCLPTFYGEPYL